jgi:hypothetical protein
MATILLNSPGRRSRPQGCAGTGDSQSLSWENLIYIADFLRASGQHRVSLGGGEPAGHPECVDFILYLLDRGFEVTLCTDGILSPPRLEEFRQHLAGVPVERLRVLCHFPGPVQTPGLPQETPGLHRFLAVMGPWTQGSYTIHGPDFSLDFLFEAISRFGLKRQVRLSLAHPVPGSRAGFIQSGDLGRVVKELFDHRQLFETQRVRPDLDCGWPLCKFSDEELGWLHRFRGHASGGCRPACIISPDLRVSYCLALSHYQSPSLFEFDDLERIHRHFSRLREGIRAETAGIYQACAGCLSREDGGCDGGGLCRTASRGRGQAPTRGAGVEDEVSQDRLPGQ